MLGGLRYYLIGVKGIYRRALTRGREPLRSVGGASIKEDSIGIVGYRTSKDTSRGLEDYRDRNSLKLGSSLDIIRRVA